MPRLVAAVLLLAFATTPAAARDNVPARTTDVGVILAGERIQVRDDGITFSAAQVNGTSAATRAGFVRWARTEQGRTILRYLADNECAVTIVEDGAEPSVGSAPQPGLATLAKRLQADVKRFVIVLNPTFFRIPEGATLLPGEPANAAEMMSVGWAAEMLHVYFYAQGISLPHHRRDDFQRLWLESATELGFPRLTHGVEEEGETQARVVVIGDEPSRSRPSRRSFAPRGPERP